MQTLNHGYKSLSFLLGLNWDRVLMTAAMVAALYAGAFVALI